jgi:hypothetical protein
MKALPFFALIAIVSLTACSPRLTPFSEDLIREYGWTEQELQKIQFYLSEDIVLRRQYSEGSSRIEDGDIRVVNGEKIEQVVIPRGTPGALLFQPRTNRFAISFENSDDRFLMFGPNPRMSGRFVLLASEWDRQQGQVTYDGSAYWIDANDAMASLMVDLKRVRKVQVQSRTAKGRSVK